MFDYIWNYYKKLIQLRKQNPIIVYGTYELLLPDSEELYVYTRTLEEQQILVICNYSENQVEFEVPETFANAERTIWIGNYGREKVEEKMTLKPYECMVIG